MGFFDLGVYTVIHLQADFKTGIWTGSAGKLLASAPRGTTLRDIQRSLESIEQKAYIKRFRTPGCRGNYRCLVNKYEPEFGALIGQRLNADASTSWQYPIYEPCTEDGTDVTLRTHGGRTVDCTEDAPILELRSKNEELESKTIAQNPGDRSVRNEPDLPGFSIFWHSYPRKVHRGRALKAWLSQVKADDRWPEVVEAVELWCQTEQWSSSIADGTLQFIPHPTTFLNGHQWEDKPPAQTNGKRRTNGRPDADEVLRQNLENSGLNSDGTLKDRNAH
jgi:hypothetical protein